MADAVRYPAARNPDRALRRPGRHQVERLSVMRKACERTWAHYAKGRSLVQDFDEFFQEVLSRFDVQADEFSAQRIQDELIGQMTELLGVDYDVLALDMTESESRQRALVSEPTPPSTPPALPEPEAIARHLPILRHLLRGRRQFSLDRRERRGSQSFGRGQPGDRWRPASGAHRLAGADNGTA